MLMGNNPHGLVESLRPHLLESLFSRILDLRFRQVSVAQPLLSA
jgi:hypothetical protein